MQTPAQKISRRGESHIKDLLPGSDWINGEAESGENYDIFWEGLKIDVKTTEQLVAGIKTACQFYQNIKKTRGVILVMVAFLEEQTYYWVEDADSVPSILYRKLKDSLTEAQLLANLKGIIGNEKN